MKIKTIITAMVVTVFSCSSVAASSAFDNMDTGEQAQAAGAYIEEIIKDIQNSYMGESVSTDQLVQAAIAAMAGQLDDYSQYIDIDEYNKIKSDSALIHYSPDFVCSFKDNGFPVIEDIKTTSANYRQGLRIGDDIREIGGISAYGIGEDEYTGLVTKTVNSPITMKIGSTGSLKNMDIQLSKIDTKSVEVVDLSTLSNNAQQFNNKTIGYIKVTDFSETVADEFEQATALLHSKGIRKVIIDFRGNTGGHVDAAIAMAQQIVPEGVIITTKDKSGNKTTYTSNLKVKPYDKCAILVDGATASAAEIVASAMQDSGAAKIIGEQTYGKGIMQSVTSYEGLGVLKMTTHEYSTRLGKLINGVGITPDISISRLKFVAENDGIDSQNVIAAMKFLGYKVDIDNTVTKDIGRYQLELGLPLTYKMDAATVNAINLEIYADMINNDRALTAGYLSLLS